MKSLADKIINSGVLRRVLTESETTEVLSRYLEVLNQRNELLDALKAIEMGCSFPDDDVQRAVRDRARAAIAKVEGKE